MKINGTNNIDIARIYAQQAAEKKQQAARAEQKPAAGADRAEFSDRAKELQAYRRALDELPPVRAGLVERLKQEIAEGGYQPDGERIAEGMARELKGR